MSFASYAALVRDSTATVPARLMSLRHCISRFKPLGYQNTLAYLERTTGAAEQGWSAERLIEAIDALELERGRYLTFEQDQAHHRRGLKAAGRRDLSRSDKAALEAQPWLTWPRPEPPSVPGDPSPQAENLIPFREAQRDDFTTIEAMLPPTRLPWTRAFEVTVYDDQLRIPGRIHNPELREAMVNELTTRQQVMVHCLYTRHADGHTRQRHLHRVLNTDEPWAVPYVVALVGEYVVEIVEDIRAALVGIDQGPTPRQRRYGRFVSDNHPFLELTRRRVASYWNEHYRDEYNRRGPDPIYPGFEVLQLLESAANPLWL